MAEPTSERWTKSLDLFNRRDDIEAVQNEVGAALERFGFDDLATFAVRLAIEEAVVNGLKHGNSGEEDLPIRFEAEVTPEHVAVTVVDRGPGFDPDELPDPTDEENIERPCGRGVMLMRAYMSDVRFVPPGNRVEMVYRRGDSPGD